MMQKVKPPGQESPISELRNQRLSAILKPKNEKFEGKILSADLNNLKLLESHKSTRMIEVLYQNPLIQTPSTEFRLNLIYYYVFFILYSLLLLGFFLLGYRRDELPYTHLEIHIICISLLFLSSLLILLSIFFSVKALLNSPNLFLALSFSMSFYLIFADERVLCKFTNNPCSSAIQPLSLGLICLVAMSRIILFDNYFCVSILGFSIIVTFLTTHLAIQSDTLTSVISEFFLVTFFIVFQIIDCKKNDSRIKQLFWRLEYERLKQTATIHKRESHTVPEINTDTENILKKFEEISLNIKSISKVVIYNEIKKILKSSLSSIHSIKKKVAHSSFETSKIELSPSMDDEDRTFLCENFMDPSSVRNSFCQNTFTELGDKIIQIRKYGLSELEGVLSGLGKNWNFDIFFVYETTGHSISLVSKYLFQKWNLFEALEIFEETETKYFRELENVKLI